MFRPWWTIIILLALPAGPGEAAGVRQELLAGGYLSTIRNLRTEGATLAYRIAFLNEAERGFSLIHPRPLTLGFEARGGWLWEPESAGEAALLLNLSSEIALGRSWGLYFLAGLGGSYSGAGYTNVARDFNFIQRGVIGGRFRRFVLQLAYEHRSNAGLWAPNRGIDLITAETGMEF